MFLVLPLPAIVWWLAPAWRATTSAIRMPFFHEMAQAAGEQPAPGGVRLRRNVLQRDDARPVDLARHRLGETRVRRTACDAR